LLAEQVSVPTLSSLRAHDGWIAAYSRSGLAAFFQERSITARSFAPRTVQLAPVASEGVALVSRAQLIASDGPELSQRSVLDGHAVMARFAGCTQPRGVGAQGTRVFIGCAEGLLQLLWDASQELFLPELIASDPQRVIAVRTTERFDGALLQLDAHTLGILGARGSTLRRVELAHDVLALELRRQGNLAMVLTADGVAHEVDLTRGIVTRSLTLLPNGADGAKLVLNHAYAYVADPRAARVLVLRLRTMQLEAELALDATAYDLALVGVPSSYTDERE
jgi:hypothetical protein